jgi:hypothetical protein
MFQGRGSDGPVFEATCELRYGVYEYTLPERFLRPQAAVFEIGEKKRQLLLVEHETIASRIRENDGHIFGVPVWYSIGHGHLWVYPAPLEPATIRLFYTTMGMHGWLPK